MEGVEWMAQGIVALKSAITLTRCWEPSPVLSSLQERSVEKLTKVYGGDAKGTYDFVFCVGAN